MRFIFVSVPSREGIEEYQALREEVESQRGSNQWEVRDAG